MSMQDQNLKEFTQVLSTKAPVPGGGGASALAGAIGVALGNMVGSLTVGKKTYADVEEDVRSLMEKGEALRIRLLDLIDADAEVFEPLSKAYGIPKEDPDRGEIMENALNKASEVPMEIMRASCEALDLMEGFAQKGSKIAISDAGVGAVLCKAALKGASLNVFINTKSMKNRQHAQELEKEADQMLETYCAKADAVFAVVTGKIRPERG